ncbi:hypothetical protein E1295_30335 [Nonomuraea mesophila]|uniref:OmpR/PhoB-type domain-containing protein n=1 Tax=Nonomuraea mesophila TaxID=2530382 RepID=A0A4R5F231_9ACTN|nr:winged helix-turn-helix domain-containing protein [Nonomuraea mesophila]TDE41382.1 hypothetical protein E1295_30335 [Nonomuraea mesophila]
MRIQIRTAAPVEIVGPQRKVTPRSGLSRGMLVALALLPGTIVSYSTLYDILWEQPPASAHANIRTYISRLRDDIRRAGLAEHLRLTTIRSAGGGSGGGVMLGVEPEAVDLLKLRSLRSRAQRLVSVDPRQALAYCKIAADLNIGGFGTDLPSTVWFETQRTWSTQLHLSMRLLGCRAQLTAGDLSEGFEEAKRLFQLQECRQTWTLLIAGAYLAESPVQALDLVDLCRREYVGMGLDMPATIQRLHLAVLNYDDDAILRLIAEP